MPWFNYQTNGFHESYLTVVFERNAQRRQVGCLVDSGAAITCVPQVNVYGLLSEDERKSETDLGISDASGKPLRGTPILMQLNIDGLAPVSLVVNVGSGLQYAVLGQTFFEKFAITFENFATRRHSTPAFAITAPDRVGIVDPSKNGFE